MENLQILRYLYGIYGDNAAKIINNINNPYDKEILDILLKLINCVDDVRYLWFFSIAFKNNSETPIFFENVKNTIKNNENIYHKFLGAEFEPDIAQFYGIETLELIKKVFNKTNKVDDLCMIFNREFSSDKEYLNLLTGFSHMCETYILYFEFIHKYDFYKVINLLNLYSYDKDLEIPKLVNKGCIDEKKLEEFRKKQANYLDQFYYVIDCVDNKKQIASKIIEKGKIYKNDMLELLFNIESSRSINNANLIKKYVTIPEEYYDSYGEICPTKCLLECKNGNKNIIVCPDSFEDYHQEKCNIDGKWINKTNIAINNDKCTYKKIE